jgi:DNA-binding CsgD family transcriptional regulator
MLNFFIIVPLVFVMVYFFTDFIIGLVEKTLAPWFKRGFALIVFVFLFLMGLRVFFILSQPGPHSLEALYLPFPLLRIIKGLFIYGALLYLFLNLKHFPGSFQRTFFNGIGITFAVGYTLSEICMMGLLPVGNIFLEALLTDVVMFGYPVVVFLILKRYYQRCHISRPQELAAAGSLESFFAGYGISKREGELIDLIVKGHSNREIEALLFISLETVKKHIYNIYKKTGVKNRLQLDYLIRNYRCQNPTGVPLSTQEKRR